MTRKQLTLWPRKEIKKFQIPKQAIQENEIVYGMAHGNLILMKKAGNGAGPGYGQLLAFQKPEGNLQRLFRTMF